MNITLHTNRVIVYSKKCPDCGHAELTRKDFELSAYDPMRVVYGHGSFIGNTYHSPPTMPESPQKPDEFWSRIHCDLCKRPFHPSIIEDGLEIVSDSAQVEYEERRKAYEELEGRAGNTW
jgi:hypothetical protein